MRRFSGKRKMQDDRDLMLKEAAIIGIFGACHRRKLCQMIVDNMDDLGTTLICSNNAILKN